MSRATGKSTGSEHRSDLDLAAIAKRAYELWLKSGCKHGCDQQFWLQAEAELMAHLAKAQAVGAETNTVRAHTQGDAERAASSSPSGDTTVLESLAKQLDQGDEADREQAIARLTFMGSRAILLIMNCLDDESPKVRATAIRHFHGLFPKDSFSPTLCSLLESANSKDRLAAIREIVIARPEVREAIAAHVVGWDDLFSRLLKADSFEAGQMPKLKNARTKPKGGETIEQPMEPTDVTIGVPEWKPHLNSYREKQLLRFAGEPELHAMIELLWTEPFLNLPHCTPDGKSIVVPAEAVEHLARAGAKFTAARLKSITDFTPAEISKLRR